jgi:hypothetical protein
MWQMLHAAGLADSAMLGAFFRRAQDDIDLAQVFDELQF